jgi:hypothetical protein
VRTNVLSGVAFAVATIALGSVPASACNWRGCSSYDYYVPRGYAYYPTAPVYGYAPAPAYSYYPPGPVYGFAPPPAYGYHLPAPAYSYAPLPAYGYYPSPPIYSSGYYRSYYRAPTYVYRDVRWRRW